MLGSSDRLEEIKQSIESELVKPHFINLHHGYDISYLVRVKEGLIEHFHTNDKLVLVDKPGN